MSMEPKPNFISIWGTVFKLLGRHFGLLLKATLILAAPFFILNGLANANHMMSLADAAMAGVMIPNETMRVLWGLLVGGDALAMLGFSVAMLLVMKYLYSAQDVGFGKFVLQRLPGLLKSGSFWLFLIAQIIIFALINMPHGVPKLGGMVLFACSVLVFFAAQDKEAPARGHRLSQLDGLGWLSLVVILILFPVLYIIINGYLNMFILLMVDVGAQKIAHWFPTSARSLPFGVITLSKFISLWFNLLLMLLLLSTHLAMRGSSNSSSGKVV